MSTSIRKHRSISETIEEEITEHFLASSIRPVMSDFEKQSSDDRHLFEHFPPMEGPGGVLFEGMPAAMATDKDKENVKAASPMSSMSQGGHTANGQPAIARDSVSEFINRLSPSMEPGTGVPGMPPQRDYSKGKKAQVDKQGKASSE
jgi:hypothetical protein